MRSTINKTIQVGLIAFLLVWACTGCASLNKKIAAVLGLAEPPRKPTYYIHTVKWHGESLSIIAKWYTGNLKNWEALAQANPNLTPSRLFIDNRIRIPEKLLKTREPMSQQFVASFYTKPKRKSLPPKTTPPPPSEEEEEKLFGPKHYPKK
jgi:hypothetical protein